MERCLDILERSWEGLKRFSRSFEEVFSSWTRSLRGLPKGFRKGFESFKRSWTWKNFGEVSERTWKDFEGFWKGFEEGFSSLERSLRGLLEGFGEGFGSFEKSGRGFGVVSQRFLVAWRGL